MSDRDLMSDPGLAKAAAWVISQAPAFAGAVVSLAFIGELSQRGRMMAVVVGACTAMFLGPALIDTVRLFWADMPETFGRAMMFLLSLSAMGGLPKLLTFVDQFWGDPLGLLDRLRGKTTPAGDDTPKPDVSRGEGGQP